MDDLLQTCRAVAGSDAAFTWVSESFLFEKEVAPFTELPLWVAQEDAGLLQVNIDKARREGLTFRPLAETISDTLEWSRTRPSEYEWRNGLSSDREAALLQDWSNLTS